MIIDCDANATYLPDERIRGVISACLASLGNPSSLHRGGQRARAAIEEARASVGRLVGAGEGDSVVFTAGATEANNTVISTFKTATGRIISALNEHPCVLGPIKQLAAAGRDVVFVAPNRDGMVTAAAIAEVLTPDTAFVSIMAANNEVGVINPLREIASEVRRVAPKAVIHSDAAQLLGKGAVSLEALGVDLLTISAHKIGALSGTGAIIIRKGIHIEPLLVGGPQEGKIRGGTENVLGISVFGIVAEALINDIPQRVEAMAFLRDSFEAELRREIPDLQVNGADVERLPNTSNVYIPGIRADDLVVAMDLERILLSSGAACSSGKPDPSHVLMAMGQKEARVQSTIRVSFRADLPQESVPRIVSSMREAVERMRKVSREGAR